MKVAPSSFPKLKDGLVMIKGFRDNGVVSDEAASNFRIARGFVVTYTGQHYPNLVSQIENPFEPEYFIPKPAELMTKDAELEGESSKVKLLIVQEAVKRYSNKVAELDEHKKKLCADIWSICPRALQDRIEQKSLSLSAAFKLKVEAEDEDDATVPEGETEAAAAIRRDKEIDARRNKMTEYNYEHSKHCLLWLWRSIIQIMELGESSHQSATELRTLAKSAIERLKMLTTESITDYRQRFIGAYARYEDVVKTHGDGRGEPEDFVNFVYESDMDRASRFINSLDKTRYLKFIVDYENDMRSKGVYNCVEDVVTDALRYKVIKSSGATVSATGINNFSEVAVFAATIVKPKKKNKEKKYGPADAPSSRVEAEGQEELVLAVAPAKDGTKKKKPWAFMSEEEKAAKKKRATCWNCGKVGHFKPECPSLPDAQEQGVHFAEDFEQFGFFCGMATTVNFPASINSSRVVLGDRDLVFDTGSETRGITLPGTFLQNVRHTDQGILIKGIDASGTAISSNIIGTHPHFGDLYVCDRISANVLNGTLIGDDHEVVLVKKNDLVSEAQVKTADGTIYHFRRRGNLLVCNIDFDISRPNVARVLMTSLTTVKDREKLFSLREIRGARAAHELKLNSGLLSNKDLAAIPWRGMGIVPQDVARAEFIYGKPFEEAAGKTTQRDYGKTVEYVPLSMPPLVAQEAHSDLFACGPCWFMLVVLLPVDYWHVQPVESQGADHLAIVLLSIVYDAKARGFEVPKMTVDPQSAIVACRMALASVGCVFDVVAAGAHVVVAERAARTVEERVRGAMSGDELFPYDVDRLMLSYCVMWIVQCRNSVPSTNSPAISPRESYLGRLIDASVEMRTRCGQYCHVTETVSTSYNSVLVPRVVDCIALISTGSLSGSWKFLSLRSGRVIVRNKFTVQPMNAAILSQMNVRASLCVPRIERVPRFQFRRRRPQAELEQMPDRDSVRVTQHRVSNRRVARKTRVAVDHDPEVIFDGVPVDGARTIVPEAVLADDSGSGGSAPTDAVAAAVEPSAIAADKDVVASTDVERVSDDGNEAVASVDRAAEPDLPPVATPHEIVDDAPRYNNPFRRLTRQATKTDAHGLMVTMCLNLSLQSARKKRGADADAAADAEIKQIVDRKTIRGRMFASLSSEEIEKALPLHLFFKEKFKDSEYERMKGRAVVLGNFQDRSIYEIDEMSAPTVSLLALMTIVVIALKLRMASMGFDVTGAFLYAKMKKKVVVWFPPHLARILMRVDPRFVVFVCPDGSIYCDLDGALYGTVEAARLWFEHITATLKRLGFEPLQMEPCVFMRGSEETWTIVTLYVDDGKAFCQSTSVLRQLGKDLSAAYTATFDINLRSQYLGMIFDFTIPGECSVGMPKLIADVLLQLNVRGGSKYPHDANLYVVDENSPLLDAKRSKVFYSVVYKLYYCSIRTEVRIQVAVHFLTSRVTKATEEDWEKLFKVLRFLNCTKRSVIKLKPDDGALQTEWFIDVGHAIHVDMRSQTGSVGKLNGATIYVRTTKQKIPTKSSTESEHKGASDEAGVPLWVNELIRSLGMVPACVVLREDNTAAIMLHNNGRSNSVRTRHIKIREFWLKYHIDANELKFVWVNGNDQLADALSKPLVGGLFIRHFDAIHGVPLEYLTTYPR